MSEDFGDLVAALDQARSALVDVAKVLADYRRSLEAEGFSEDAALALVRDAQRLMWGRDA